MSYIGNIKADGTTHLVGSTLYGTCSTAAGTAAKVVTCDNFDQLLTGVTIHVKFTNKNSVANPTLNVNGTGAKNIYRYGTTRPSTSDVTSWIAGAVVSFTYDGTSWIMNDWLNTTYSTISEAEIEAGTATSPRLITAERLKHAIEYWTNKDKSSFITVGPVNCDFETITAACNYAKTIITSADKGVTLLIASGVYEESITLNPNPGISMIGYGVIIKANATYPNAALYSVGGRANFIGLQFENSNASGNAYAVHVEAQDVASYEGGNVTFIDCIFTSAGNSSLGMGLGPNLYYRFKNCEFYTQRSGAAAAYIHDYPDGTTGTEYMSAIFDDCFFMGTGYDMLVDDAAHMNGHNNTCRFSMEFRNSKGQTHKTLVRVSDSVSYTSVKEAAEHDTNLILQESSTGNDGVPGLDYAYGYFRYAFSAPVINNRVFVQLPKYPFYFQATVAAIYPYPSNASWTGYTYNWFGVTPYIQFASPSNLQSVEVWIDFKPY